MRITNSMMINTFNRNLGRNLREMNKINEQLSSGLRINRPSDDPTGITYALRLHTNITENQQYQKNVSDARSWMETTDTALNEAGLGLQRARELAVQGANGTNDLEAMKALAKEIGQIRQHIEGVSNTEIGGRYIFSGTMTNVPAFAAGTYQGNSQDLKYEIGPGITLPINVPGDQVFADIPGADSVFKALTDLENQLNTGQYGLVSGQIKQLDKWISQNLSTRAEIGARLNRLELTENRLVNSNLNLNSLLDKTENVDETEAITQLKMQETTYNTSLAVGARIIQPTLMDFLR
ncbi:MAG TPA: flagellar hook-associated protein FlgL [Bacillota bacterium]|nr:flagellar hook-associated protein FlgL [Bacillota bacterium]